MRFLDFTLTLVVFYLSSLSYAHKGHEEHKQKAKLGAKKLIPRQVQIKFDTSVQDHLPVTIQMVKNDFEVKTDELNSVDFKFTNTSDKEVKFNAIPTIEPIEANVAIQKVACFCYDQQSLKPHETKVMKLVYKVVGSELVQTVAKISFNYTLFAPRQNDVSKAQAPVAVQEKDQSKNVRRN